jgi:hypothetical protein
VRISILFSLYSRSQSRSLNVVVEFADTAALDTATAALRQRLTDFLTSAQTLVAAAGRAAVGRVSVRPSPITAAEAARHPTCYVQRAY